MERDDTDVEWEARIEARDKRTPNPENRAGWIFRELKSKYPNLTNWDLLCFSAEFLASNVLVYEWLQKDIIKELLQRIYVAHYALDDIPDTGIVLPTEEKPN